MAQLKETHVYGALTVDGDLNLASSSKIYFGSSSLGDVLNVPYIYKGSSSTKTSNTTRCSTVRFGYTNNTLYIWAD